jgi:hypothetical protein
MTAQRYHYMWAAVPRFPKSLQIRMAYSQGILLFIDSISLSVNWPNLIYDFLKIASER